MDFRRIASGNLRAVLGVCPVLLVALFLFQTSRVSAEIPDPPVLVPNSIPISVPKSIEEIPCEVPHTLTGVAGEVGCIPSGWLSGFGSFFKSYCSTRDALAKFQQDTRQVGEQLEFLRSKQLKGLLDRRSVSLSTLEKLLANTEKLSIWDRKHFFINLLQVGPTEMLDFIKKGATSSVIESLANELARSAYNSNITQSFRDVAKQFKVPIVYRESTEDSMALQQNGMAPKPQEVKNKSSLLLGGFIPANPLAGKIGDQLRALKERCQKASFSCQLQLKKLAKKLEAERENLAVLLGKKTSEGKPKYQLVPLTRLNAGGETEVLTFTDEEKASEVHWVKSGEEHSEAVVAKVIANAEGLPLTADTDLVLIGHPKESNPALVYDHDKGYRLTLSDPVIDSLNQHWQRFSKQTNKVIQHADETQYGLNAFNDSLVAFSPSGERKTFNLRKSNSNRAKELEAYGFWLKKQTQFADISLPTPHSQMARHKSYMNRTQIVHSDETDSDLDHEVDQDVEYQEALQDYQVLWAILGQAARKSSVEYKLSPRVPLQRGLRRKKINAIAPDPTELSGTSESPSSEPK